MATKIRVLSEETINKIAAGEVIENPASIIKELVENSLDAGASKIVIEIHGGGLQLIKVSDNGCGMGPDDALLSLQRHATSKIKEAEDLFTVGTMGFRGEALASIGAVSQMTLQTALDEGDGVEVFLEGGRLQGVVPTARSQGTTITVRQLFYNVPARRKFQKTQALCAADVTRTVVSLSLANPCIGFELYNQEGEVLKLLRGDSLDYLGSLKKRIADVLGDEFLEGAITIEADASVFSFKGILGSFQNTRPNRALQYQFVNGRSVLCPAVSYAVKDAFGTRIPENRFPIYVLHLDIPKEYVDVNVHPQKKEIRLREEKWIKQTIEEKIQEKLSIPNPIVAPSSFALFSEESFFPNPSALRENISFCDPLERSSPPMGEAELSFCMRPRAVGVYDHFLWVEASSVPSLEMGEDGLVFIDLNGAAARVLFEFLEKGQGKKEQQLLLLPISFPCSLGEEEVILACLEEIESFGFSLQKGRQSFMIEAIPSHIEEGEALEFIRSFISLEERGETVEQRKRRKLASSTSRIASSRKGFHTLSTGVALLEALLKTKTPAVCPLGEKIITRLGKDDLQQMFSSKRNK